MNARRPRKWNRATAIEARNANRSVAISTPSVTVTDVASACGKSVWPCAASRVHAVR